MLILHMIETGGPGGAEQMLLRLADAYGQRGFSQMVCLRKDGWLAREVRRRGLSLKIIHLNRLPDVSGLKKLYDLVRKQGVTAIHAHEFAMNVRGAILGRLQGIPVAATVHSKGYFGDKWVRRQAYRFAGRSATIIAVTEDIRQYLIEKGGLKAERVCVIPNGVDAERFRYNEEKRRVFRGKFGVQEDQLLLGTVGSYYQVKGHRFLIEAMKRLVAVNQSLKLVMAGQGPLSDQLQKQAEDSGLGKYVQITGFVDDIPGFLSALDIFVMPSISEGMPLSLLEAAANERCIVATNVGGIPDIIVNQKTGILVPPGNVEALTDGLARLFDPSMRISLAANAAATVKENWSFHRTVDRYLELLLPDPCSFSSGLQGGSLS